MIVLPAAAVEQLLDRDALIDAVQDALVALSGGDVSMPPRTGAQVAGLGALLGVMPAYLPASNALGAKLVSVFPTNTGSAFPTHQAIIVLFDPATGAPDVLMDGTRITAQRTAAASAVATRLLARPDAAVLTILGTGVQARAHAQYVPRVCPVLREVRIAGRDMADAEALASELTPALDVPVRPFGSFRDALDGADVVCATTHAAEPVMRREWLGSGTHVNSVGFNPLGREVDASTVAESMVVVESRASALAPPPAGANDLLWPIRDGLIGADHVHAEIGELVTGARPGRTDPVQLTLYKSVGVAVEDLAAATLVLSAARGRGVGTTVTL